MRKESAVAVVYNVFFVIIATVLLAVGTIGITASSTIFSTYFYQESITTEDITHDIKVDLKTELKSEISSKLNMPELDDEINEIVDTAIDSEFFDTCLSELVNYVFFDEKINNELIKDEFMDIADDVMTEVGLSQRNMDDVASVVSDGVDEVVNKFESTYHSDIDNVRQILNNYHHMALVVTTVVFVITAALFLISIFIHRNKGASFRALGISGIISNAIILAAIIIASPIMIRTYFPSTNSSIDVALHGALDRICNTGTFYSVIAIAISLLLLVIGICMSASYKRSNEVTYTQQNLFNPPSYS